MSMSAAAASPFVTYAPEFGDVLGPSPEYSVVPGVNAHEGPVYVREWDAVLFTTVPVVTNIPAPGDRSVSIGMLAVQSLEVSTFAATTNMANGMTLDRNGELLICEQGTRMTSAAISRMNLESREVTTVVDAWFGLPFNSPNDVVVKSDGTIWFTDPGYGYLQGFRNQPLVGDFVYRYDPADQSVVVVADSFKKPNGLAFSPDESVLYINDSGAIEGPGTYYVNLPHHIRAFDVRGVQLSGDRLFAVVTPGIPDGLKVDSAGRVYSSSATGVKVYSADGKLLGEILAPGVANFCFGGVDNDTLFLMCDTNITIVKIAAKGA
ncbi:MAG TPA: SMP-30/gluconolactonase/LRE family protein [Thermoanaerobaculia bacterium]|nr:SMP-30/gluconolactonase/LRE family protein [Thermoanaerobaculia bacterium]